MLSIIHFVSSSSQQIDRFICQIWRQLLSSTLPIASFYVGCQSRSSTRDLWPLCLNRQGCSCSFFSFVKSQMSTFLPYPHDPKTLEANGLHCTFITAFFSVGRVDKALVRFLRSQTDTFSSAEPEASKNQLKGEKSREQISSVWATIQKRGFLSSFGPACLNLVSQMLIRRSSEQLEKIEGWKRCQATSQIGALWCRIQNVGTYFPFSCLFCSMSQMQILLSEKPERRRFLLTVFQLSPQPQAV